MKKLKTLYFESQPVPYYHWVNADPGYYDGAYRNDLEIVTNRYPVPASVTLDYSRDHRLGIVTVHLDEGLAAELEDYQWQWVLQHVSEAQAIRETIKRFDALVEQCRALSPLRAEDEGKTRPRPQAALEAHP